MPKVPPVEEPTGTQFLVYSPFPVAAPSPQGNSMPMPTQAIAVTVESEQDAVEVALEAGIFHGAESVFVVALEGATEFSLAHSHEAAAAEAIATRTCRTSRFRSSGRRRLGPAR